MSFESESVTCKGIRLSSGLEAHLGHSGLLVSACHSKAMPPDRFTFSALISTFEGASLWELGLDALAQMQRREARILSALTDGSCWVAARLYDSTVSGAAGTHCAAKTGMRMQHAINPLQKTRSGVGSGRLVWRRGGG